MYSYEKLERKLADKGITRTNLARETGISSRTIARISKGEKLSRKTLGKMADYLSCNPDELYEIKSDNPVLQRLREEKEARLPGGLYHELQIRMTYNSNHMEGSILSEEQTRLIFETNTIDAGDGIPVDDILETVHHFRAIDYVIDHAEDPLTEDFIKELHYIVTAPTTFVSLRRGGFLFKAGYGQITQAIPGRPPVFYPYTGFICSCTLARNSFFTGPSPED